MKLWGNRVGFDITRERPGLLKENFIYLKKRRLAYQLMDFTKKKFCFNLVNKKELKESFLDVSKKFLTNFYDTKIENYFNTPFRILHLRKVSNLIQKKYFRIIFKVFRRKVICELSSFLRKLSLFSQKTR